MPIVIGPGKGNRPPPEFFPKVEIFHKNEGELFEDIQKVYSGDDGDLNVTQLLLPAVQKMDSFVFVKVEDQEEGSLNEILIGLMEEYDGSVLLPAVQSVGLAADDSFNKSSPDLMLKIDGLDGESQGTPEQSIWDPLDGFG